MAARETHAIGREEARELVTVAAEVGEAHPRRPEVDSVAAVDRDDPEVVARYLLLNAVLDQGPDIAGVRQLLRTALDRLYAEGLDVLGDPSSFFANLPHAATVLDDVHDEVKRTRAVEWARGTDRDASNYSVFFFQTMFGSRATDRVSWYLLARWGSPLLLFWRLEAAGTTFREFLEGAESAELMGERVKKHDEFGIDKAIGDKAFHLFAKWYVDEFDLVSDANRGRPGWDTYSYELPLDGNVGRVLFRTGWFQEWIEQSTLEDEAVEYDARGPNDDKHYLRVTNVRRTRTDESRSGPYDSTYERIVVDHLRTKTARYRTHEVQHMLNVLAFEAGVDLAAVDDGLLHVATTYCSNSDDPDCAGCPLREVCVGHRRNRSLVTDFRT